MSNGGREPSGQGLSALSLALFMQVGHLSGHLREQVLLVTKSCSVSVAEWTSEAPCRSLGDSSSPFYKPSAGTLPAGSWSAITIQMVVPQFPTPHPSKCTQYLSAEAHLGSPEGYTRSGCKYDHDGLQGLWGSGTDCGSDAP